GSPRRCVSWTATRKRCQRSWADCSHSRRLIRMRPMLLNPTINRFRRRRMRRHPDADAKRAAARVMYEDEKLRPGAIAKALGVGRATVIRWRDEEGWAHLPWVYPKKFRLRVVRYAHKVKSC